MANQNFSIPQEGHELDYSGANINIAIKNALEGYSNDTIDRMLNDKAEKKTVEEIQRAVDENHHTHSNKSVLDGITDKHVHTHGNISALNKIDDDHVHTHSNKSVLDGITAARVAQWDAGGSGGGSVDISGKEDKENKVFELSDGSTDEQYPSAKATVDYVKKEAIGRATENGGEIFNNYVENIADGKNSHAEGSKTEATGENAHAEGRKTNASGKHSHAQNYNTQAIGESSTAMGANTKAYNNTSVAEGFSTEAGDASVASDEFNPAHAEGFQSKAVGYASHAEGKNGVAFGDGSHVEGEGGVAEGIGAHAEGGYTTASGMSSHAEGDNTEAAGFAAHTEGYQTEASGYAAHAEGQDTEASGLVSHAEGLGTRAVKNVQHVQGKYNIPGGDYAHIVGNGEENKPSNAHTLDWDGNAWFAGEVTVGNTKDRLVKASEIGSLINNAPSKTIGLNEVVPAGSIPSICDFEFKPNTPLCIYNLYDSNVLPKGQFFGEEIPFLTTRGNLIIVDNNNNIKLEKYIDPLINITNQTYGWNVSDTLTQNGLNKVWSNKFYLTMDKYKERVDSGINSVYTFELDESDFAETGIPAKLDNIPIASPCFYPGTANGTLYGGDPFKLKFSYNNETNKYIMTIRGFGIDLIFYQLQHYSKAYIYYQLETPYVEKEFLAMNLEEGDKILFENDYSYIQKYLDINKFFKKGTNGDYPFTDIEGTTPTIAAIVPQNTLDALNGFSNAARIFNEGQASDDDVAQDYSWIGDGNDSLDYTSIIQNKIKELSTISNGGTIYLGNGTYKINNFIEVYDNIKIIGTGNTTIQQTNKNEHVLVISGSNITIKDLKLKLYAMTAEEKDIGDYNSNLTACLYINSNNGQNSPLYNSKYLNNIYCKNLTVEDVYLSGSYGFRYINGKPTVSNDYEHYRGCGLINEKLFFNYATFTNVHISGMYHGLHGVGGSNDITIFCDACKTMVYGNGGYLNLNIYGHSYYDTDNDGNTISMSDEVGHFIDTEQSYIAEYVYDTQWLKNIFIFDGYTMNNRYLISQIGGASYAGNDENDSNIKLEQFVVDYGRGNRAIENFQNTPYHIGAKYIEKTGLTSFKANDPITQNALSGAGVWGNINSNDAFDAGRLTLSEICRYPNSDKDINKFNESLNFFYALSHNTPTEENPIEIIIDISNRPIFALPSCFIQFCEAYIASDFEVSFKYSGHNDFSNKINVKDNIDVVWYFTNTQYIFKKIDKIKIVITKALYIEKLKYQNSGYVKYEIEYNPDKKVGICNVGVIDANFTGRAFLGECGGNVYGDLVLNKNSTIKNVPSPVDDTDVVNKRYVDDQKEDKSNKVTDITGNETSEKYPTVLAVIDYLKKNGGSGGGGMTEQEIRDLFAEIIESKYVSATDTVSTPRIWMHNNNDWSGFVRVDTNGNETTMEQTLATLATKKELGDIDAALDEIIAIQNSLIGGASS